MNCVQCGTKFDARHAKHVFCSDNCQARAKYRRRNPKGYSNMNPLVTASWYETREERDARRAALWARLREG